MVEACAARFVLFKGNPGRAVLGYDAVTWLRKEPDECLPKLAARRSTRQEGLALSHSPILLVDSAAWLVTQTVKGCDTR
jgi:hypothetical protein